MKNRLYTLKITSLIGLVLLNGCDSSQTIELKKPSTQPAAQATSVAPSVTGIAAAVTAVPQASNVQSSPVTSVAPTFSEPSPGRADTLRIMYLDLKEGWGIRDGRLLHTGNAGKTWQAAVPDGIGVKDRLISAQFQSAFEGFAYYISNAKQPKLLAAHQKFTGNDGTAAWETAALPTAEEWETSPLDVTPYSSINPFDASYVMLTGLPSLGQMEKTLYRTVDRGKTWTRIGKISSTVSGYPTGIAFRVPDEGWITAYNHGSETVPLFRTKDGGKTWTAQHVDVPDEFKNGYANTLPPVFDQENNNHGVFIAQFVAGDQKTYVPYETQDSGNTWLPMKFRLTDVQDPPVYHFDGLIEGRAISADGQTIYTMDTYNKEDWRPIKSGMPLKGASQFVLWLNGYGWVLLNGQIKITQDSGKTWADPA